MKLGQQQNATAQLHARLLDPAVCAVVERLSGELKERKNKAELVENDLLAAKFTPDRYRCKLHEVRGYLALFRFREFFYFLTIANQSSIVLRLCLFIYFVGVMH